MKKTPTGPPNSYPCLPFVGFISVAESNASFSSVISFFVTDRVTRTVATLELSDVTLELEVTTEVCSIFLSGVRPLLGDRRLGVTATDCCVTFCARLSSDVDFLVWRRPPLLAGDLDRERDRLAGERDLRAGLRAGEVERERNRCSFYITQR